MLLKVQQQKKKHQTPLLVLKRDGAIPNGGNDLLHEQHLPTT